MTILKTIIIIWLAGWLLCSTIYVISSMVKAKSVGITWSLKQSLEPLPTLLLIWPFSLMVYVYAKIKK